MRLEDELYIAQAAEAALSGSLSAGEKAALDGRLAADPELACAYQEYFHTISSLQDGARRSNYKMMLRDVHEETAARRQGMKRLIIHFNPRLLRTAVMAASVALLTSAITVWVIRAHEPKSAAVRNLQLVRHEIASLKAAQEHQQKQIQEIKESTDATEVVPPQSNYAGTGFALSNDGYLITNYHVVEGAEAIQIQTRSGKSYTASIVAYEPKNDIAVLRVDDKHFRFGKGDLPYSFLPAKAPLGSAIYTLGFPQDEIVYNEGYIASSNGFQGDSNQYRLEVPAGPGQSGAPVLSDDGEVIGIIRSKDAESESTTYAVTSKTLLRLLRDVPKDKRPRLPQENRMGRLSRGQQIEKLQDYTCMVQVYKR
jgi:S1-C subfamily serine protease